MKANKLKLLSLSIYCLVAALCSIAQCMESWENEEKKKEAQISVALNIYKNFIFDLGDVLLVLNQEKIKEHEDRLSLSFKKIVKNPVWQDLEIGSIEKSIAYLKISENIKYRLEHIDQLITTATSSLTPNKTLIELLPILKAHGKKLYCLTNIPREEISYLRIHNNFFDYFDVIFASGFLGIRKPSLAIYKYVINFCNISPEETVFIDDNESNIKTAETLGIKAILFDARSTSIHIDHINFLANTTSSNYKPMLDIQIVEENRIISAYNYVINNVNIHGMLDSFIGKGLELQDIKVSPTEIFSSALSLTLSKELALHRFGNNALKIFKDKLSPDGLSRYFLEFNGYPYDIDTSSIILGLLYEHKLVDINTVHRAIGKILSNFNENGIIRTFFDENKTRLDAVSCANALYLICLAGRQDDVLLWNTKKYISDYLIHGQGSPCYTSKDLALYLIVRLYNKFPHCFDSISGFRELLIKNVNINKHLISQKDTMGLISNLLSRDLLNLNNDEDDYKKLILLQQSDGSWPLSSVYIANSFFGYPVHFANTALNTIFAMKVLEARMIRDVL